MKTFEPAGHWNLTFSSIFYRMASITAITSLAVLLILAYWLVFLGPELVSTIRLCCIGNDINTVLNVTADIESNSIDDQPKGVPKIMHRMWKYDVLESRYLNLPVNWTKSFNYCNHILQRRNWTTMLWTDDSIRAFMIKNHPSFMPVYDSYPYNIQRVDAARYFILYHFGGVYMDLDVGCRKDKDLIDLLHAMDRSNKSALLPLTQPFGFSNDVLITSKASPFFQELLDALPKRNKWFGSPYLTVMYSTGPMFLSLQYLTSKKRNEVLALPPALYTGKGTRYFKHLRGSTWHQDDAHFVQWMVQNKNLLLVALIIAVVISVRRKKVPQKHNDKIV